MSRISAISPENFTTFGDLLKHLRKQAGLTQRELSVAVGYSDAQISRMEQNQRIPDAATLTARFVPALHLEREPEWVKRLLELAGDVRRAGEPTPITNVPAPSVPRHNLPVKLTRFIGRENEIALIKKRFTTNRLMTLMGSGGIGKTRLALQAARELLPHYSDGVWLVELAPLTDPALVPQTVCTVLDVKLQGNLTPLSVLTHYLHDKTLLLVLDNCEHLIDACAQLSEHLLTHCPNVCLLASSREALGIEGETAVRVPSLSLPDVAQPSFEMLQQSEAVRLFVERASAVFPGFALTDSNAPAITQVCHRLDGIALAIELAAARVKTLKVEQIAARLDDAFRLLTGGSRTALPRQQTLRATIDWSHSLLTASERVLLRRLAVFAGGWTLEAAECVCVGEGINISEILDLLTQLANKSLVVVARAPGEEARYFILETTRQYAREKLQESGEGEALRRQHLDFYLMLAEALEMELKTAQRLTGLKQSIVEYDNFRVALEWSMAEAQPEEIEKGLQLASALHRFWHYGGRHFEGREWLEKGLALSSHGPPMSIGVRARALYADGFLAFFQMNPASARSLLEESVTLYRKMTPGNRPGLTMALAWLAAAMDETDKSRSLSEESVALGRALGPSGIWELAEALFWTGWIAFTQNDDDPAHAYLEEAQLLYHQSGDRWNAAAPISILGAITFRQGDYPRAHGYYQESLHLFQEGGDKWATATVLEALVDIERVLGNYPAANAYLEESLKLWREMGLRKGIDSYLRNPGIVALYLGDHQRAKALLLESLSPLQKAKADFEIALTLVGLSNLAQIQGQRIEAARLLGAAEAIVTSIGPLDNRSPVSRIEYERLVVAGHTQLDEAAWAEGRAMTMEPALEYALKTFKL